MRTLALSFLMLVIAGSAVGAPRPIGRFDPPPPAPALRGAQRPSEAPVALPVVAPPQPASLISNGPANADDCRRACARAYYFCIADDGPEGCGPSWGQCRADCQAPNFSGLSAR